MSALAADESTIQTQAAAVRLAERYIVSNGYQTQRNCPASLARLDGVGAFNMQPHCRHYDASEATAFAVQDEEALWRVFFRKVPPRYDEGRESFRVVEIFRTEGASRAALKGIELFLPENAALLVDDSPAPKPTRRPPPSGYMGIELLKSTEQDLFAKLSPTRATQLFLDADEVNEGYCYGSPDGISAAFRRYATQYDTVEISKKPVGENCKPVSIPLDRCIGPICLGHTRENIERLLGVKLTRDEDSGDDMESARYEYDLPMSDAELKVFAEHGITEIPVTHLIWLRFDDDGLYYLGVWRREDLP